MNALLAGLVGGAALGGAYFGWMWITVRRLSSARSPGILILGSYLGRLVLAMLGFYALIRLGGITSLLAGLVGFLGARLAMLRRVARMDEAPDPTGSLEEKTHCPRSSRWS